MTIHSTSPKCIIIRYDRVGSTAYLLFDLRFEKMFNTDEEARLIGRKQYDFFQQQLEVEKLLFLGL